MLLILRIYPDILVNYVDTELKYPVDRVVVYLRLVGLLQDVVIRRRRLEADSTRGGLTQAVHGH